MEAAAAAAPDHAAGIPVATSPQRRAAPESGEQSDPNPNEEAEPRADAEAVVRARATPESSEQSLCTVSEAYAMFGVRQGASLQARRDRHRTGPS